MPAKFGPTEAFMCSEMAFRADDRAALKRKGYSALNQQERFRWHGYDYAWRMTFGFPMPSPADPEEQWRRPDAERWALAVLKEEFPDRWRNGGKVSGAAGPGWQEPTEEQRAESVRRAAAIRAEVKASGFVRPPDAPPAPPSAVPAAARQTPGWTATPIPEPENRPLREDFVATATDGVAPAGGSGDGARPAGEDRAAEPAPLTREPDPDEAVDFDAWLDGWEQQAHHHEDR